MSLTTWLADRLGYEQHGSRARGYRAGYSDAMQSAAILAKTSDGDIEKLAREYMEKSDSMRPRVDT